MIYALDSNTISFLLRPKRNPEVALMFERAIEQGNDYVIPPLCYYEVSWHLLWKNASAQSLIFNELYENSASRIRMSEEEFALAAKIKAYLMERGTPIGKYDGDILIAAHCIANGYTLVTDNTGDFSRIDGLVYVNWKK